MKLFILYVEKCRQSKTFVVKASSIAATVLALFGLGINVLGGTPIQEAIMMALILWMIWYVVWMLFTKQIIRTSAKIKERNLAYAEKEKDKSKLDKRRKAEEREKAKKKKR